jgi:hypothetical protein
MTKPWLGELDDSSFLTGVIVLALKRTHDWPEKLLAFLTTNKTTPFTWGTNDCCTFAAGAIQAMTGTDIAADFRGYGGQSGAFAAIKRVCNGTGVADALAYCATKYGLAELASPLLAQRGDLLLVSNNKDLIAGIVDLSGMALCVTDAGLIPFPITTAQKAYRV